MKSKFKAFIDALREEIDWWLHGPFPEEEATGIASANGWPEV